MKITKLMCTALVISAVFSQAHADYTHGYIKRNGTYVSGYHRSRSDSTKLNNYSTKGNFNPYTGKRGSKSAYKF